jgi:hypothetical protein
MNPIRKRLTYANVISTLALFLVLGGASALAATNLGKNTVGANQLKKNAVTNAKLKNGAVTGAKINLSTLGAVPNATNAAHATNADNATNANHAKTAETATKADSATKAETATKADTATSADTATLATNFSRYQNIGLVKLAVGDKVVLLSSGPFTITGVCTEPNPGERSAAAFLTTTQSGASVTGEGNQSGYQEANFEAGEEIEVGYGAENAGPEVSNYGYGGYYAGFTAASADGTTLLNGELTDAVNAYGAPCSFFGYAINMG